MSETQQNGNTVENPIPELVGMGAIAQAILEERPPFVLVGDDHITSEPQDVSASLVEALTKSPAYQPGDVGYYVEALYDYAKPELVILVEV